MMESTLSPSYAASFISFLLDVSLKSLPIFAAAGLVCLGLRRASAASRHALWVVTVLSLLCLPAFCVLLPRWSVSVLPASAQHRAQTSAPVGSRVEEVAPQRPLATEQPPTAGDVKLSRQPLPTSRSAVSTSSPTPSGSAPDVSPPLPVARVIAPAMPNPEPIGLTIRRAALKPTIPQLILAVWLIGVLMVLVRALVGIMAAQRLVRGCQGVVSGPLADAAELARETLSLSFRVPLREGPPGTVVVPMTFGLLRPVVLLPHGAAQWPAERLRVVMLHETAHIKRRDWLTTMLAEVACAFYWFYPLVWLAAHRLRTESEQACDDLVLTSGVQAVDYADHLLEVVRGLKGRRGSMPAVVTMAQERDLAGRLKTILAESKNRSAATGRGLALAVLAALVMVMPLSAMHPVARRSQVGVGEADSPWMVTLPDGTQAGLISVAARNPATGQGPTWMPDGRPLESIPPGTSAESDQTNLKLSGRTFTAGLSFPSRQIRREAQVTLHVSGDQFFSVGAMERTGDRDARLDASHEFPPGQGHADIVLTIAEGPYTTLATGTYQSGGSRRLPTGELVTVSRAMPSSATVGGQDVKIRQVMLTVPSRFVSDPNQYGLDLLGLDGQPLRISHTSSNIPNPKHRIEHLFFNFRASELPEGGVSGFRFRFRSVHTFVFRGVALKPIGAGVQMSSHAPLQTPSASALPSLPPTATAAPSATPKSFDATTWAQTAGDAALKLVAVSDKPSNTKRWWRPDGTPFIYDWHKFGIIFEHSKPLYPQGFIQQWPVLIFRSGHPSSSYVTIDGWEDPHRFDANGKASSGEFFCIDQGNSLKGSFTSLLAKTPQTLSVRMRVGAGPWQPQDTREMSYTPERLAKNVHQITDGNSVASWKVRTVSRRQIEVIIQPAEGIKDKQVRLVAFDGHGRGYAPTPSAVRSYDKGYGPQTQYTLAVPLSRIRKFVIETRPYHYFDFYGIARQPITEARSVALPSLPAKAQTEQDVSASNLHQIGLGIFRYAAAHDQHFPDAARWMDEIIPCLVPSQIKGAARRQRIASLFDDPAAPAGQTWSYAYNRTLSGLTQREIDEPNRLVAVFESTQGFRNASDRGQSVPKSGWHRGGSYYAFTDAHVKWLGPEAATPLFTPIISATRREIPIRGQVYDRRTGRPFSGTVVIFSKSPETVTPGSVWPSSLTDKAGRFRSVMYPVKNYLMVLENNRFRLAGKTLEYASDGDTGTVSIHGIRSGPSRSASPDYVIRWSVPSGYSLQASSSPNEDSGTNVTAFVPVARAAPR